MREPEVADSTATPVRGGARTARTAPANRKFFARPLTLAVCLTLATLAVYGRALTQGFVHMDDPVYVTGNDHVLGGLNYQNVRWSFVGIHDANWIPLTWLSLMLDANLFGARPFGFHLTNLVLHIANTLLLF